MRRKILGGAFALLVILIFAAAMNSWHIERLDNFVRTKIEDYSKKNLPFSIYPGKTEVKLLPLSVTVNNIKIVPKKGLSENLKEFEIQDVKLSPSFLHLFIGKLHLSYLHVETVQLHMNMEIKDDGQDPVINLDKILRLIPISQIKLSHIDLNLELLNQGTRYNLAAKDISTLVTNDVTSIALKLKVPTATAKMDKHVLIDNGQLETHLFLTNKSLILSELKIKEGASFILASGSTQHILPKNIIKSANINLRTQIDADRGRKGYDIFKAAGEENILNPLKGQLRADLQIKASGPKDNQTKTPTQISALVQSEIHNLAYDDFNIGDLAFTGEFQSEGKLVTLRKAHIQNPGLKGDVENIKLNLQDLTFSDAKVDLKHFELQKYLEFAINNKIPASGTANGQFTCSGNLKSFSITCPGHISAENMLVNPDGKDLVRLAKMHGEGSVSVNDKEVTYKAQLNTDKSKGSSQGVINFKTGFDIKYDASYLDLEDIKKISVLTFAGNAQISGSTQGNSDGAVFDANIDGKSIELDQYKLGDVSLYLTYKDGSLYANKIQGSLESSRYLGQLVVDLRKDWLTGKIQFPFLDLAVAKEAIKNHLTIPVAVSGSGSAIVSLDSPLSSEQLTFKAKSRLYNGTVDAQHFDTADVDISSELGKVTFNAINVEEKNSTIQFSGTMDLGARKYNIAFKSPHYLLDDFYYAKSMNAPAKGAFNIDGLINGTFDSPGVEANFSSSNFNLSGEALAPINGNFSVNRSKKIFNVSGPNELKVVYKDLSSSPEVHVDAAAKDINLASMLTSFIGLQQIDDYKILASTSASIRIDKKDPKKINGYLFVPSLALQFQKAELRNEKEISFFFTNGKINFAPFILSGKNAKLEFKSSGNSTQPIDIQLSGIFSLSFLQIFAPFLETLEGQTSVNLRMRGDYNKVHFLGSSFIEDGFIKAPDIQHAIEEIKVDLLFNQDQIIINSIKGKFASGQLLGDGKILLKGKKDIPMNINLHADNVDMNIPDQVNTKGNADLTITGNWLPFTMSGKYEVSDGLISKELGGGDTQSGSPHQVFLPATLRDEASTPIKFDLAIIPIAPLKVKNSMIDGKIEGKIKLAGSPQSPILGGNVILTKNSQIIFMDVIFKVRDSNFVLNNTSPPNPGLYLVADARYRGYDIEMLVQGTAEKPRFKWSSIPNLTEPEIISLLTLGTTTATQLGANTQNTTANGAVSTNVSGVGTANQQSGAAIFSQNPLSKELKNRFGFDIQFSSKFDTANSVAVPKVSAAKQLNENTSLIGSYQTGRDAQSNVTLRYQLNKDFAATMNMQSQRQEEANQQRGNTLRNSDVLGVDLEFRKEFK